MRVWTLPLLLLLVLPTPSRAGDRPALESLRLEMDGLVESPGTSRSVAAGLVNPALWPTLDRNGLYLSWEDGAHGSDFDELRAVAGLRHLGLGITRLRAELPGGREVDRWGYSLGTALGDRSGGIGVSWAWTSGAQESLGQSRRLTLGAIKRWRPVSVGLSRVWEHESDTRFLQADLGLRPFGPRWTLFADFLKQDIDALEEADFGYGVQAHLYPGLTVAARLRDTGEFGLRVDMGLGKAERPSYRQRMDRDGNRLSSIYAVELTGGPHLTQGMCLRPKVKELDLKGRLPYRRYRLFDDGPRFLELLRQIQGMAEDPTASGVALKLSDVEIPPANLWELRAQLEGLRAAGKTVQIHFSDLDSYSYMLASVADELWMDPEGILDLSGMLLGRSYYKRMLEKLGIGFDEWRFFTYKSAAEGFSRESMSEADREQRAAILGDWYATYRNLACEARGLAPGTMDRIRDERGYVLPKEALELGLVDRVGDWHEMRDAEISAPIARAATAPSADLAGLLGDVVWGPEEWGEPDRIAVLYAIGPCAMDEGIEGGKLSETIRAMREDDRVKAVILRADSPGGQALPSDLVARELKLTAEKKPVLVSQGQVAGSGGYWISMNGDEILASPFTITGSIGVIGGHVWDDGLGEKLGMDYDKVQIGVHADILGGPRLPVGGPSIPHRPLTHDERALVERLMRDLYAEFVAAVAEGRGMTPEAVDAVGQGRVWSGIDGQENGLVDEIGGLWDTLQRARVLTGLPEGRALEIVEAPRLGWINPGILGGGPLGLMRFFAPPAPDASVPLLQGETWVGLNAMERGYLEQMFLSPGLPLLLMEPLVLEGSRLDP